ncbi:hypothetical protein ACJX0J_040859, partial [Zea mays]
GLKFVYVSGMNKKTKQIHGRKAFWRHFVAAAGLFLGSVKVDSLVHNEQNEMIVGYRMGSILEFYSLSILIFHVFHIGFNIAYEIRLKYQYNFAHVAENFH